jgi:rhodanese-related sulfurtransferase
MIRVIRGPSSLVFFASFAPLREAIPRIRRELKMLVPKAYIHFRDKLRYETDAWDLNEMLRSGASVVVIDARGEAAYNNEHIPQAISLPHRQMNVESTANFDQRALYVTYCDGIGCNASTKGALNLAELGFDVKELLGGLDWWKRDGYPTATTLVQIE